MLELEKQYHRMLVTAVSPDGQITGSMNNQKRPRLEFRDERVFHEYDAGSLANQIGALLCRLETGRQRGVRAIFASADMEPRDRGTDHWDGGRRRYEAALGELVVVGRSGAGAIKIRTEGRLDRYQVKIHPDLLAEMEPLDFLLELHEAHRDLRSKFSEHRRELLERHLPR